MDNKIFKHVVKTLEDLDVFPEWPNEIEKHYRDGPLGVPGRNWVKSLLDRGLYLIFTQEDTEESVLNVEFCVNTEFFMNKLDS